MPEILLGKTVVPYTIRESDRASRISLKIDNRHGLQVILPSGAKVPNIEELLYLRQQWILKHLKKAPVKRQFVTGETFLYMGQAHVLEVMPTQTGKRTAIGRQAQTLRVRLRAGVTPDQQAQEVRHALESWYRTQARVYLNQRTAELAQQHGFRYEKITIKGQQTRWGSCSTLGNLNFNWRLMLAPTEAIDYVIIHELCHLREHNHSAKFWKLVERYYPAYATWERWLSDHSADLTF